MRCVERSVRLYRGLGRVALCLSWLPAVAVCAGQRLEYQFEVGDRLVYERRAVVSALASGQRQHQLVDQIQVWCFEIKGDEALILLDLVRITDGHATPMQGIVFHVDRRGRLRVPPVSRARAMELEAAFEVLPVQRGATQSDAAWKTLADLFARCRHCTRAASDPQQPGRVRVDYEVEYPPGAGDVLGRSHAGRYWFDPAAGIVTRVESLEEDRTADRRVRAVTVLRQRKRQPVGWAGRRAAEAQRYLLALRHEDRLLAEFVQQPLNIERTLERLHRLWAGTAADFDGKAGSPFAVLCRARQKHLSAQASMRRADARYAGRWLGRRAVPWSLQNGNGQTLASEQARNGVVIECLWSTAAPGAFAVLDTLRRTQEQLAGTGVRILCLNMDQDAHLARRVIARLPPDMIHVLAGPLQSVERPPRLPLVRVLDRDGVVRWVRIGWQPSYADAVAEARRWAE